MKLQDDHKYDSAQVGMENLYVIDYEGNFFINSPAIIAPNTTLIPNNSYLLIDSSDGNIKMYPVLFLDAYFEDDIVYVFVQDMLTRRIRTLELNIECTDAQNWVLIDITYYNKLMDYRLIKSYCSKCKS